MMVSKRRLNLCGLPRRQGETLWRDGITAWKTPPPTVGLEEEHVVVEPPPWGALAGAVGAARAALAS